MDLKMEVYTPSLELLGLLEVQNSVIWESKAFGAGSFSVTSLLTADTRPLLAAENILWIAGDEAGVMEYVNLEAEDSTNITVKGCNLTGLLARRILWGRYDLTGTPPQIMHYLVNECAVNPTRGDVQARKIPGLVLLDPPTCGAYIRIQRTGGELLETLEELGATYGVAFGIRFNPAVPQMEFWTRWGVNRSIRQSVNDPVFYSTELDDVLSSKYTYNSGDYRNVALIAGEGEGNDRVMVTVEGEDETYIPDVPTPSPTPEKYTINLSVDPSGGGVATGGGTVNGGTSITVTAAPAQKYGFVGWRENGTIISTEPAYTFTVNRNRNLTAVFVSTATMYTVTATIDPAGAGTVTGAGQYQEGATATITAAPAEGYTFSGWTENGTTVSTSKAYTFTVTGNRALSAVFSVNVSHNLPDGYTEVKYIESTSTCYVSIGLKMNYATTVLELDIEPKNYYGKVEEFFFNVSGGSGNYVNVSRRSENEMSYRYYGAYAKQFEKNVSNQRICVVYDGPSKEIRIGDSAFSIATNNSTTQYNVTIFSYNSSSDSRSPISFLYGATLETDGTMMGHFIPCINPSGVAGLYDIIRNKFYGNSGDGTFIAGPAV